MTNIITITESAIVADEQGYNQHYGVTICDLGDSITIGATEHHKSEVVIDMDNQTITSKLAGWSVSW